MRGLTGPPASGQLTHGRALPGLRGVPGNRRRRSVFRRSPHASRRGTIVLLAAFVLTIALAMVAFAVDVGYVVHVDTEFQRTADACALAAVQHLPDRTAAIAAAQQLALQNKMNEGPVLSDADIEFGTWSTETATFVPTTEAPDAVRVTVERTAAKGNPLRLFFAPIIGTSVTDVRATAVAMTDRRLCGPLVGIDWIDVPGSPMTDSYFSSKGDYLAQEPGHNGNLCSDGWIDVKGAAYIDGDANPGGGHLTSIYGGSAVVTGNTSPRLRPLDLPSVDVGEVSSANDNADLPQIRKGNNYVSILDQFRNFLLDGGRSYTLPSGDYYFHDLILTGSSMLYAEPGVNIYVTGRLDTSGGDVVNSSQIPGNLRIFMTGGPVRFAGSSDSHMVIYAPDSEVVITGDSGFYGAVVGKTLSLEGGGSVHYDEDLNLDAELNLPQRVSLVQ
ncbi:TadG family pilus assembly protein [Alienimonas sp. DA493]|uniref:DUF7305 domain-containing protein n=1 Tax=Alienimonas sp. DA493 TaxID=3373605 RepID=UPI003754746C